VPVDASGCQIFVPGDFDHDADVDMTDFAHLQACLGPPSAPQTDPRCADARLDSGESVDQLDVAIFSRCLSGSNRIAKPSCVD
jgi:hypothetical protein